MTALGHTAAASLVRGHPLLRLLWGFLSHAILDYSMPEWRPDEVHLTKPRTWFHPWVVLQAVSLAFFGFATGDWWAIIFGMLPDAIEAVHIAIVKWYTGRDLWTKGELLLPWHRRNPDNPPWSYRRTVLWELALVAVVVWAYA